MELNGHEGVKSRQKGRGQEEGLPAMGHLWPVQPIAWGLSRKQSVAQTNPKSKSFSTSCEVLLLFASICGIAESMMQSIFKEGSRAIPFSRLFVRKIVSQSAGAQGNFSS